jgi:carbon storage regulator CsrA
MLVLSRRLNQGVAFPGTDTIVRVLSVKGNVVRVGIEAPPEVTVLREELLDNQAVPRTLPASGGMPRSALKQMRDRLQSTAVSLGAVQLLLDTGCASEAGTALSLVRDDLQVLRYALDGELEKTPKQQPVVSRKRKALLVEDDASQRELLAGFLRMGGLDVDTAGDGADALDYLHTHTKPDVVLLDMGLPRCDGASAVRQIRHDPGLADLRIVAVTGSCPDDYDLARGPAGIDRWFRKPIDPASLLYELTHELAAVPSLA